MGKRAISGEAVDLAPSGMRAALPVMAAVFISFLIIGMALPVVPLHVHDHLGRASSLAPGDPDRMRPPILEMQIATGDSPATKPSPCAWPWRRPSASPERSCCPVGNPRLV